MLPQSNSDTQGCPATELLLCMTEKMKGAEPKKHYHFFLLTFHSTDV